MTDLDLAAIRERYTLALNAKPSKGPYSEKGITALTDSVCDMPELMAEIDRLNATIQRVRELHSSEGRTWADFDTCADCHKAYPCPTTRALEGGEQ